MNNEVEPAPLLRTILVGRADLRVENSGQF
jgi:hypothetical protein